MKKRWIVQTWWGDAWSYGSTYYRKETAQRAAKQLRAEGYKVRIIEDYETMP